MSCNAGYSLGNDMTCEPFTCETGAADACYLVQDAVMLIPLISGTGASSTEARLVQRKLTGLTHSSPLVPSLQLSRLAR